MDLRVTDEPDWDAVRVAYEAGQDTVAAIAARYGITRDQLSRARRQGSWTARHPGRCRPRPKALTARVMLVIDRLVLAMETDLAQNRDLDPTRMRLLETMVKTLERLNAMEREDKAKGAPKKRTPAEEAALRQRLAERIASLAKE